MELLPLTQKDKATLESYLKQRPHELCGYAFENIFIWGHLFEIFLSLIDEKCCLFFKNDVGIFMPLPPLGDPDRQTVHACFDVMEGANHNRDISRIENIGEEELGFYQKNGFRIYEKSKEYIVAQQDIATLSGARFRHKRNLYNFFRSNHQARFRDYEEKDKEDVLELYREWMSDRASKNSDKVYLAMLNDGLTAFSVTLEHAGGWNLKAKVVECGGRIRAFTCGFPVAKRLFCINFEVADLSFRGLAQFVFTEFAKALKQYPEINIMDDSGIENIRRTKMSYRPVRTVTSYTALLDT